MAAEGFLQGAEVGSALGEPVRLVATSLVEAGASPAPRICSLPYSCLSPIGLEFPVVDLPSDKIRGSEGEPVAGRPIDAEEAESFVACPACGGMIDIRDLAIVLAHLKPLPHSGQDRTN